MKLPKWTPRIGSAELPPDIGNIMASIPVIDTSPFLFNHHDVPKYPAFH
jgi:hypothetical protein